MVVIEVRFKCCLKRLTGVAFLDDIVNMLPIVIQKRHNDRKTEEFPHTSQQCLFAGIL
jgi:hypothetical protein